MKLNPKLNLSCNSLTALTSLSKFRESSSEEHCCFHQSTIFLLRRSFISPGGLHLFLVVYSSCIPNFETFYFFATNGELLMTLMSIPDMNIRLNCPKLSHVKFLKVKISTRNNRVRNLQQVFESLF